MNTATLEPGGEPATSHWLRRAVLVVFSLGLLAAVGITFTRVIAARVPEQRATLERLITDRTGLAVRFDNVHFSWSLDGTSAVFERVELTDPDQGRVRVVAPELRVEFDTWDFLRHQQFSLGHVTLKSPDIEITADARTPDTGAGSDARPRAAPGASPAGRLDEAALIGRYTAWAELMPMGKVEVEGARVHLLRRGDRAPRHSFTLSQAVVSRGASSLNAFGTLLLSQDIGQSLFVSAKLEGLGSERGVAGDVRVIARRVFLDKLGFGVERGRGTLDARLELDRGRVRLAKWQASARELDFARGQHFDHFTMHGSLKRARQDVLIDVTDLQVTRGAHLERAPRLLSRVTFEPGSVRIARVTVQSERVPFMVAELLATTFAPDVERHLREVPADWSAAAGDLRGLRFDSLSGSFDARVVGAELVRADHARISNLTATLHAKSGELSLVFDPRDVAKIQLPGREPRALQVDGGFSLVGTRDRPRLDFTSLRLQSGEGEMRMDGPWADATLGGRPATPLTLDIAQVDRALMQDVWDLLALEAELPQLADIQHGRIVAGQLKLLPLIDEHGERRVNWPRSRGQLSLAGLTTAAHEGPRLSEARGTLELSRHGVQLRVEAGSIEDLEVTSARLEWPRQGTPRLQASLRGGLQSALLQRTFREQGLERLSGNVQIDAEARGDAELRDPARWRIVARLSGATVPLAADLPPMENVSGTVRSAGGQLRGLALAGQWLGGPILLETRRSAARGSWTADIRGESDAQPLLQWLGHRGSAGSVEGRVAWTGTLQRSVAQQLWQVQLDSSLAGLESRLPEPFGKSRSRVLPVQAQITLDDRGVREFVVSSGRDRIRGRVDAGVPLVRFELHGVAGELHGAADAASDPRLAFERLELKRAPLVLAAAGSWLPADTSVAVSVADLRHAGRSLGGLSATLGRQDDALEFSVESREGGPHELRATGGCGLADLQCQLEFSFDTPEFSALLAVDQLPPEWPTRSMRASGELAWRGPDPAAFARALTGQFELESQGAEPHHQLSANASLADGQLELSQIQGGGPAPDQVFRGGGRVSLLARSYDLTLDYERAALSGTGVLQPARAGLNRALTVLRGSAARRGWTEPPPAKRVQWHGTWSDEP